MTTPADRADRFGQRISDPLAIRALAHPARLTMLERLSVEGPATATECAAVVGLSPSACSYHLRLLARYGFVEESPDRGDGRERVWQANVRGWQTDVDETVRGGEAQAAQAAVTRVLVSTSDDKVLAWADGQTGEPAAWRRAAFMSNSTIVATPEEVEALTASMMDLLAPYLARERSLDEAPDDARYVHAAFRLIPRLGRKEP
jgi:DNA-binding transcriptional ArsR family regulator